MKKADVKTYQKLGKINWKSSNLFIDIRPFSQIYISSVKRHALVLYDHHHH